MAAKFTPATGELSEEAIKATLAHGRLTPGGWSSASGDVYESHSHPYHKVLYCLQGFITFTLDETGEQFELHRGDRLDIDPDTAHSAIVGLQGVYCIEAARPSP
jgi:mannose-6-phosphate isomerase-like protein (cupin superfamily)